MPVWKFRSLQEAERALWIQPGAPGFFRRLAAVHALAALVPRTPVPRGVQRFRGMAEANAEREARERSHSQTLRRGRSAEDRG